MAKPLWKNSFSISYEAKYSLNWWSSRHAPRYLSFSVENLCAHKKRYENVNEASLKKLYPLCSQSRAFPEKENYKNGLKINKVPNGLGRRRRWNTRNVLGEILLYDTFMVDSLTLHFSKPGEHKTKSKP